MYYAHANTTPKERVISGAFASTMHLLFIALLVFGVNWQKKVEPQVNIVDLWSPPSAEPKAVAPRPAPEPPRPEPKPVVQPKVEPTPPKPLAKPEAAKPDIAMKEKEKEKEKIEKERRVAEEKQKEAKKRETEAQAAQKAQAEAQRLAKEQADAQNAVAAQAAAARKNELDKYRKGISDKIKKFIVRPPNLQGNEESEFDIVVLPDGNVLGVKLKKASGNAAYDNAVERAINRSQPLPMPPDPALLRDFRELNLKFKAQD
jgi:colicin import membrane protein